MRPAGFEPTTPRLKVECSSRLSYGRILNFKCDRGDLNPQLSEPQSEVLPIELQPQLGRRDSNPRPPEPKSGVLAKLNYAPRFQDGLKIGYFNPKLNAHFFLNLL